MSSPSALDTGFKDIGIAVDEEPMVAMDRLVRAGPARGIDPDVLTRAEQMLARQIGPLARILVREAAKHARSPRELSEHLAVHIDDPEVRKLFDTDGAI